MDIVLERGEQCLADDIVLIDGFSSSGKSLLAAVFGYLRRSEQWQIDYFYENIAVMNYIGELADASASSMLKNYADRHLYDLRIGRGVNFRKKDMSSPYADGLHRRYISRLNKNDGNQVVEEIRDVRPILPLHVHYVFGYSDILLRGFDDRLKLYAVMLRSPFSLIDAWYRGGWEDRVCNDDREFSLCCKSDGKTVPWYVVEYMDQYLSATLLEKSILVVYNLYCRIVEMYESLSEEMKKKMLILSFEQFSVNPSPYIDDICSRLETERSGNFEVIMEKLQLPRKESSEGMSSLDDFMSRYRGEVSSEYGGMLEELEDKYLDFVQCHTMA